MEFLKDMLGEDLYKQVSEKMGNRKLILNDGNYIPKSTFNEKNEELKIVKEKLVEYEKNNKESEKLFGENKDLKAKYDTLQSEFSTKLELKEKEISNIITKSLLKDELSSMGAVYPDLLIKNINLDDVIVKDNKILNKEMILNPFQEQFKDLFVKKEVKGSNTINSQGIVAKSNLQQMEDDYKKAVESGNTAMAVKIKNDIFNENRKE